MTGPPAAMCVAVISITRVAKEHDDNGQARTPTATTTSISSKNKRRPRL